MDTMDKTDKLIIKSLQENAKITNADLAKKLNMAPSAIWERIKKLEEKNVIKQYSIAVDSSCVDLDILAYITININSANWSDSFSDQISCIENILELHEVIGADSYLAKIRTKDMNELSYILKNKIGKIKEVTSTKTTIVARSIKDNSFYQ